MKLCLLVALLPLALCGEMPLTYPKVCADNVDNAKTCVKGKMEANNINFSPMQILECVRKCPHPHPKGLDVESHKEKWAKFGKCFIDEVGTTMKECIEGKVDFDTVVKNGHFKHGKGGKGHGSHGVFGPIDCSPEVEECVKGVAGDWFDKQDELKGIMCEALDDCGNPFDGECKTQIEVVKEAACSCKTENEDAINAAKDKCKGDEVEADKIFKGKGAFDPCSGKGNFPMTDVGEIAMHFKGVCESDGAFLKLV